MAAFGRVEVPIRASNVVARRKSKGASDAVNGFGSALDLQEHPHRRLIEIEMKAGQAKGRPEFLVTEPGPKSERAKDGRPIPRRPGGQFPFEFFFVARARCSRRRSLRSDHSPPQPARDQLRGSGSLDAHSQKAAATPEGFIRRIKEGISLEDSAAAMGTEGAYLPNQPGEIGNAEFNLRFADGWAAREHGRV